MNKERKNTRLKDFDYATQGAYFVTICTKGREHFFGKIENGEMVLSDAGVMLDHWWRELENKFPDCNLDAFIIMPNHIHGIVWILNDDDCSGRPMCRPFSGPMCQPLDKEHCLVEDRHTGLSLQTSLPRMMQWFKTMTTNQYISEVKNNHWKAFEGKLWQRSYHDRIIRNERELNAIREYIEYNPENWEQDDYF